MKIDVTAEDIKQGVKGSAMSCPIALAVQRKRGYHGATVGYSTCGAVGRGNWVLPKVARDFIAGFDNGREVAPFSFNLKRRMSK